MFTSGETVGLAEWIIDYPLSCFRCFCRFCEFFKSSRQNF